MNYGVDYRLIMDFVYLSVSVVDSYMIISPIPVI